MDYTYSFLFRSTVFLAAPWRGEGRGALGAGTPLPLRIATLWVPVAVGWCAVHHVYIHVLLLLLHLLLHLVRRRVVHLLLLLLLLLLPLHLCQLVDHEPVLCIVRKAQPGG